MAQAAAEAPAAAVAAPTVVYVPQLPQATELINAANQQHLTVSRIEQSAGQITAVYKFPNGATNTVTYMPLPAGEAAAEMGAMAQPATAAPAVVYAQAPVGYAYAPGYYPPYAYYPYGWYPPISIGLGLGWGYRGGWGRGGWGHGGGHWR